jgi:hypothetical protein
MASTNELQELKAELAALREQVSMLQADLKTERQIGAVERKKTGHCRVCQDSPDIAFGHPPLTDMERIFCSQGHRFKTLSPDQARTLRTW